MFGFERYKSIQSVDNNEIIVFSFCENRGPFAYYDWYNYHIIFHNGSYSCNWKVGWDDENSFSQKDIPLKHIIQFLRTIKESVVSTWNGFNVSNDKILDGSRVSLLAKLKKADIDLSMKGYASVPPNFIEGKDIIISEYNKLLKKVGSSLDVSKTKEETIYFIQRLTKEAFPSKYEEAKALDRPILKIGRDIGYNGGSSNFEIRNNRISRSHTTDIIIRGDRFFIVVRGSKNKTFVNGKEISPEQEVEIFPGTRFNILNEEFLFDSCKSYKKLLFAERFGLPPIDVNLPTNLTDINTQICNLEKLNILNKISSSEYKYVKNELITQLNKFA